MEPTKCEVQWGSRVCSLSGNHYLHIHLHYSADTHGNLYMELDSAFDESRNKVLYTTGNGDFSYPWEDPWVE